MAYTPGVARISQAIADDPASAWNLTVKQNTVAVVSDGTAVLGLGDIGPEAAMPVMEGKAVLFKEFGGVDAWPLCLATKDPDEIVAVCKAIAPGFGGINLEDISAPRCFEIEARLREELDIPVFHDDQHGTAIVVLAALVNALKVVGKRIEDVKIVTTGIGAAGIATTDVLLAAGARRVVGCDREGAVYRGRPGLAPHKAAFAERTNPENESCSADEALAGADVFIGLSAPGAVTPAGVRTMAKDAIVFAMANPTPEVVPEELDDGRRRRRHGAFRLPEPDQQRARVPGRLPWCARRAGDDDHEGDGGRRRARDRVRDRARGAGARIRHPERLQPRRRPARRRRRGRGRRAVGRRPTAPRLTTRTR